LLQPFRRAGLDVERLVVRLSLVLDNLETMPEQGAWRRILADHAAAAGGPEVLHLDVVDWRASDSMLVVAAGLGLSGAIWL
jgi:hypothetical protein